MARVVTATLAGALLITVALGAAKPADNSEQEIRGIIDAYLASMDYPDSKPLDMELFSEDIVAYWSGGQEYQGRKAMAKAISKTLKSLEADFASFSAKAEDVNVHISGDLAWVTCRLNLDGTMKEQRGDFKKATRSTFVFERRGGEWEMVHEHSSVPKK